MSLLMETTEFKVADQKGRVALGSKWAGKRFAVYEESDGKVMLSPVLVVPESEHPLTASRLRESFAFLEGLTDNWDGRGSLAPDPATIASAREALGLLQASALARGMGWVEPHIGANERGQITLEWWQENRSVTVFIRAENQVDYLKAWGTNIEAEMQDGEITTIADFIALSHWLNPGQRAGRAIPSESAGEGQAT
ncbi:MAG: hypothetical protein SFU56_16765 [Capsulimonadales bacterium]|nr:hypothetical protein [Capsulimonadales bacterium]